MEAGQRGYMRMMIIYARFAGKHVRKYSILLLLVRRGCARAIRGVNGLFVVGVGCGETE